jgi:hypothetical protein
VQRGTAPPTGQLVSGGTSRSHFAAPPEGKVTPDWREQGVWFSRAWQEFGPAAFVARATQAADQFAKLRDGETPELFLQSADVAFAHWRKTLPRLPAVLVSKNVAHLSKPVADDPYRTPRKLARHL